MNNEIKIPTNIKVVVSLFVIILLAAIFWPLKVINAGERGIVLRVGSVNRIMEEGLHLKFPWPIESVKVIDVRIQKEEVDVSSASKDLQTVTAKVALNFHLNHNDVGLLWQKVGGLFKTRIIDPAIQESVKASTAKYTAEELITKRSEVKEAIKTSLVERLGKEYINVDEVSIVDFNFSPSFNQSIENKVKAEQDALTQKNKLEQVKYEAEQAIAQAKGTAEARITSAKAEAEAIKIQAQSISAQGGQEYVNLKAVEKWNGELPNQMIPGSAVPFINITK